METTLGRSIVAAVLLTVAAGGCGGGKSNNNNNNGGGGGGGDSCTGTIGGAASLTITGCNISWMSSNGLSIIGNTGAIDVSDESQVGVLGFSCKLPLSAPQVTSIALSDCQLGEFTAEVGPSANRSPYMAIYDQTNPANAKGSASFNVSGFEVEVPEMNGFASWRLHGSVQGSLVAAPGYAGALSINLSF